MKNILLISSLLIALASLIISFNKNSIFTVNPASSALQKIQNSKIIRVGFEQYPPYTVKDPKTGEVSGYSIDMINYIVKQTGWKTKLIETTADTKVSDLQADKFDMVATPIYQTIPRAARVTFTRPYGYFGDAAGLVKKGDIRFKSINDLNNPDVTIAVVLGYTDQAFVEQNLPKANLKAMKVNDVSQVYADVLAGNSDIALTDAEQLKAFAAQHSSLVDVLFIDPPTATIPAGFMIRQGDFEFYNFLNTAIDYMEANKVLDNLDKKYNVSIRRTFN